MFHAAGMKLSGCSIFAGSVGLKKSVDGLFTDECLHTVGGFVAPKAE